MLKSRDEIVNGIADYAMSSVINNIADNSTKFLIGAAVGILRRKPELADRLLSVVPCDCGRYDTDALFAAVYDGINASGRIEVTIPSIPLISKGEKVIGFSRNDVDEMRRYVER